MWNNLTPMRRHCVTSIQKGARLFSFIAIPRRVPLTGTAEDGKVRTVGSWSLKYQDDTSSWIGENKQFEVQVFWNTSVNDLKTLLTSFDRVSKESRAMEQPRFFLMRIGFPSDFPPSTENAIARTYADRGIINWQATRQGRLPARMPDPLLLWITSFIMRPPT